MISRIFAQLMAIARSGYPWVSGGMLARAVLQAATVIILARHLQSDAYGLIVTLTSVASVFSVLAGMGAPSLHLRDLALANVSPRDSYSARYRAIALTSLPLLVLAAITAFLMAGRSAPIPYVVILLLGEILAYGFSDVLLRSMQGAHRFPAMAMAMCAPAGCRLLVMLCCIFAGVRLGLEAWSYITLCSGAVMLMLATAWLFRIRHVRGRAPLGRAGILEGFGFAMTSASMRVHADADKALVGGLASFDSAAQYSVAYRVFDVLLLPVAALLEWGMTDLFREGFHRDPVRLLRSSRRLAMMAAVAAMAAVAVALVIAPWLPWVFGTAYGRSTHIAYTLAFIPVSSAAWWFVRAILTGAGDQSVCGMIEAVGAVFNVLATVVLVMAMDWLGAVLATYLTHLVMFVLGVVRLRHRRWRGN